jgi:hypothetical protein
MSGLVDVSNRGFRMLNCMSVSKNLSALPNPYLLSGVSGPVLCLYQQKASHQAPNLRSTSVPVENTQVIGTALLSVGLDCYLWGRDARRDVNRKRFRLNLNRSTHHHLSATDKDRQEGQPVESIANVRTKKPGGVSRLSDSTLFSPT